jgi:mitochondrial protein import protein ZIM17
MRPSSSLLRCICHAPAAWPARTAASIRIPQPRPQTLKTSAWIGPQVLPRLFAVRQQSITTGPASPPKPSTSPPESRLERDQVPAYELTFTCNKCDTRSSHRVSKQGYHHGTVLITCPGCKNRHLMSDHLKVRLPQQSLSFNSDM